MVGCSGGTVFVCLQGWGTLLLAQGGIVLNLLYTAISRPLMLTVLLMLVCGALLMVTGMWLTLQFRFIQMQYPAVVLAFERQVLTASITLAAIMQVLWGLGRGGCLDWLLQQLLARALCVPDRPNLQQL
jgi:hypothetical protein